MNLPLAVRYEWKDIPWRTLEKNVFKLQTRIFRATRRGDMKTVRRLQRLLMKSRAACFLAVRKVTQENRGKRTAGIDGVKALTPPPRLALAEKLAHDPFSGTARPVRRVWIPKPGKQEKRPLGIPTMEDRARQAMAKLALEPEWEARFESHSYGFRPGRSAHDAARAIYHSIAELPKYVLDADIAKCFDRINHDALLKKLNTFPRMRRVVKQWLKAGVMDGDKLFPSQEGVPQGGTLSPLLANVALHGLQTAIEETFPTEKRRRLSTGVERLFWKPNVIRYADDFVILHRDLAALKQAQAIAVSWLKDMGLELKAEKTRITHTLRPEFGTPGFNFLGFNIRQYKQGAARTRKTKTNRIYRFRTYIKPSKDAIKAHTSDLLATIRSMRTRSQADLIAALNSKITGWANYHAISVAGELSKVNHILFHQLRRWSLRRHPRRYWSWVARKYWRLETGRWTFATPDGTEVLAVHQRKVRRQYLVRGHGSIFDGDWTYWATRMGKYPGLSPSRAKLLKRQGGRCTHCGLYFRVDNDLMEIDHIVPRSRGGSTYTHNLQLLHAHCHDRKTAP